MPLLDPVRQLVDAAIGPVCSACVVHVEHRGASDTYAAGTLDPEAGAEPCVADTLFDVASLTKLATTALLLTFVRDGAVALDDPFQRLVPDFAPDVQLEEATHAAVRPTVRQVLTHTAGLTWWRHYYKIARGLDDIAALAAKEPLAYPPGAGYAYTDLGYIMLTKALATLGGKPYREVLDERVLRPLGIDALRYLPLDPRVCAATELDETVRHRRVRGEVHDENAWAMGGVAGHAGLFGTAAALARLARVYAKGELIGEELAREARKEQAVGPNARRGLGVALRTPVGPMCSERFSLASFGHSGFTGTSVWYDPERDLLVVLLTNSVYYGRAAHGLYPFRIAVHDALAR